jgi:hypothetical protein
VFAFYWQTPRAVAHMPGAPTNVRFRGQSGHDFAVQCLLLTQSGFSHLFNRVRAQYNWRWKKTTALSNT